MEPHNISPKENSTVTDLNTPPQNSSYNTGRWNEEEHEKFIDGILEYGNEWKSVQRIVKTRSSTQARSHAQKFVLSIKKLMDKTNFETKDNLIDFILKKYIIRNNRVITEKNKQKLFSVISQGIFENSSESENNICGDKNGNNIGVNNEKKSNEMNIEEDYNNNSNNSNFTLQKNIFFNNNTNISVNNVSKFINVINNNCNSVINNSNKEKIFLIRKDPSNINKKRQRLQRQNILKKNILKKNIETQKKNNQNFNSNHKKNGKTINNNQININQNNSNNQNNNQNISNQSNSNQNNNIKKNNNQNININLNNNLNYNQNIIYNIFNNSKFQISRDSYQISPDFILKTEILNEEEHTENNNQTDPFKLDFENYQDNNANFSDNEMEKSQLDYYSYGNMNIEGENNFGDLYLNH